jgi:hypothetical protein
MKPGDYQDDARYWRDILWLLLANVFVVVLFLLFRKR